MGRVFDFAKRRIVGYVLFWILVLLFLGILYPADPPAQAGALVILGIAFLGSLLFTRRMKRKQKVRREAEDRVKQMQEAYQMQQMTDRKSKRLNSSHQIISYAVFCLKK